MLTIIDHTVTTLLKVAQTMEEKGEKSHYAITHANVLALYSTIVEYTEGKFRFHIFFWVGGKEVESVKTLELDTLEGAHEKLMDFFTGQIHDPINWYTTRYQVLFMSEDPDDHGEAYNLSVTAANMRIFLNQMTQLKHNQDRTRHIVNGLLSRDSSYTLTPGKGSTGCLTGTSYVHDISADEGKNTRNVTSHVYSISPELHYSLNSINLITQLLSISHP